MPIGIVFPLAVLVAGVVLLTLASDKAVEHSVFLASALGFSSLMIGLILASIGTDLPEMANSVVSCYSGHGDIDLGDSIGSVLTQITLVLGLVAVLGRSFKVKRHEILVLGAFEVAALGLAFAVALTGFTRVKAALLIAFFPLSMFLIRRITAKDIATTAPRTRKTERHVLYHLTVALLGFGGVAIGALAVVQSVIMLSRELGIAEFFVSFFVLAIGTSLPELVVDLVAIRKRQYDLAIGDIVGSCIVDATLSISIGQLLFPTAVFVEPSGRSVFLIAYAMLASALVILTLAWRQRVDRKASWIFFGLYAFSFALLFGL
jgi:cation:H+ antiporter